MASIVIDAMDTAASWPTFQQDGVTASTRLTVQDETIHVAYGLDRHSLQLSGDAGALGHRARRSLPNVDLSIFDDLRFWIRSDRPADGGAARPFYLEVRLASAVLGLEAVGNSWSRFVPILQPGSWELVRLSLDDLPTAVRTAVNLIQLRCVDDSTDFVCILDDLLAAREEMVADVNSALLARLDRRVSFGTTLVPAVIYVPGGPAPARPAIQIMHHSLLFAAERTPSTQARGDFTGNGFRLRPPSMGYDLYYEVDVLADSWQQRATLLEFVVRSLPPRGELLVSGIPTSADWVFAPPFGVDGERTSDRTLVHLMIKAHQEVGAATPALPPYHTITVAVDQQAQPLSQ